MPTDVAFHSIVAGTSYSSCPHPRHILLLIPEQSAELLHSLPCWRFSHTSLYETWGWRSDGHVIITPQNCFRHGLCDSRRPRVRLPEPAGSVPSSRCCSWSAEQGRWCSPQQLPQWAWLPSIPRDHPGEDHPQLRQWERGIQSRDVRSCKAKPPRCLLQKPPPRRDRSLYSSLGAITDLYREEGLSDSSLALLTCL